MSNLSDLLTLLMKKHQMTTLELAEKAGVSTPIILMLKQGKTIDLRISTAQKLAVAFGITLSQLVGEEPLSSIA